jgi:hypothetical protein
LKKPGLLLAISLVREPGHSEQAVLWAFEEGPLPPRVLTAPKTPGRNTRFPGCNSLNSNAFPRNIHINLFPPAPQSLSGASFL